MWFLRNPSFFSKQINGEWVLLKGDSSFCFRLNDTAGFIWEQLKRNKTPDQIVKLILKDFDTTPEDSRNDVENFLKQGVKNGFLISEN